MVRGAVWHKEARKQHLRDRQAIRDATAAVQSGDADTFFGLIVEIDQALDGWRPLFRAITRGGVRPPADFGRRFSDLMSTHGDHIRQECGDDLTLVRALRVIFPPHEGVALRLYRGEGAENRRRRTYGASWSLDREVAASFAQGLWQSSRGGSVLLETDAPPEAIVMVMRGGHHGAEREVLVDRRRLTGTRVLRRYPQRTIDRLPAG